MKTAHEAFEDIKTADQKGRVALGIRHAGKRFAVREQPDGSAVLTPVVITPESEGPLTARLLSESLRAVENLRDDWDGRGSLAPDPATVAHAREVLALLHAGALARGVPWAEPHVGCNERGQVTLEWWHGGRSLTVFVRSADRIDYLKAWGADIEGQMEDGYLSHIADFVALSRWLYGAEGAGATG